MEDRRKSTPGLTFTNEHGEEIDDITQDFGADGWAGSRDPEGCGSEDETAEELGDVGQGGGGWAADDAGFVAGGFTADWSQNQSPDPSAQGSSRGVGEVVQTDPATETADGFTSDPFAELPGGGFDSDPFSGLERDPFAQEISGFTSDPFTQTTEGDGFGSGPEADSPTGGSQGRVDPAQGAAPGPDPFGRSPAGDGFLADFTSDPFAQRGTGWDPFGKGFETPFPAAGAAEDGADDDCGERGDTFPPHAQGTPAPASGVPPKPRDPESSDMSEDEAANRRYGALYQEVETEKDEVSDAFNGFSQDGAGSSFFADFDQMLRITSSKCKCLWMLL
ncbi:hypothetical protein N1851_030713 [Merluccius polli]|uniref:Uncharacterized protein n=1 Tax=Merluccius polli TaxID=89951 RepID=A0AA47NPW0_MERPO|nr:hypothetical protein N1851_030713 [Merluccius polli]